jgi:4'-phosphopantetheinyl transferase
MVAVSPTQSDALRALRTGTVSQSESHAIHIHCLNFVACLGLVAPLSSWLSEQELSRANRFKLDHVRSCFILSHGFLRAVLARYLGISPGEVVITAGPHGKPAIAGKLGFSLAHCQSYAAVAVAGTPFVGVDVEEDRPEIDAMGIAQRFFARPEWELLSGLPDAEVMPCFRRLWTCKEAFVKAIGLGLNYPFDRFVVEWTDRTARLAHVEPEYGPASAWSFRTLSVSPLCDIAVAVKMPGPLSMQLHVLPRTTTLVDGAG